MRAHALRRVRLFAAMMTAPPLGIVFCLCADRAVFLDCERDLYLALPDELNRLFVHHVFEHDGITYQIQQGLEDAGLNWQRIDFARSLGSLLPTATEELPPAAAPRWTVQALVAQLQMRRRIDRWPFCDLISREIARKPTSRVSTGKGDLSRLRATFDRLSLWLGDSDQCLPRSLAFRRLAFGLGLRPSLVLGVKLDPFGAHSWIQMGRCVVSDTIERVRLYQPILVL